MIDIHSHILPFMDDGAADWEAAVAMAQDADRDGITTIIATPHHADGTFWNLAASILKTTELLQEKLREQGLQTRLLPGQEIRLNSGLLDDLQRGELLTLGGSRYLLLELPSSRVPRNTEEVCHELIIQGIVPIIAHPERNNEIAADPSKLERLIELGAFGQLTAQSLAGTFGTKLQKLSLELCRRNLVHTIASDAHDGIRRPFGLSEAYQIMQQQMGEAAVHYFQLNSESVSTNVVINRADFSASRSPIRKIFGFFSRKT